MDKRDEHQNLTQQESVEQDAVVNRDTSQEEGGDRDLNEDAPKQATKRKIARFFTRSSLMLGAIVLSVAVAFGWVFALSVARADLPDKPSKLNDKDAIVYLASDGVTELARVYPTEGVRRALRPDLIPENLKNSLVAAEDASFWDNPGFDPKRILAAALGHLKGDSSSGGASTITQQYIKNTLVGDEVSLTRKWHEVLSATKLSSAWTKDEIISAYLNTVYFGRGAIGVENAAQAYFGISATQLNDAQAAMLAGVIQSPSVHDPAVNEQSAHDRFDYVVSRLKTLKMIDEHENLEFPETIPPKPRDVSTGIFGPNGHIVAMANAELERAGILQDQLYTMGAKVVTTIDPGVQDAVVNNADPAAQANGVRIGATAIDPKTGGIRGIFGGSDGQGFNYANQPQMTGSTFKVFTLAAGLEQGIGLDTVISSAPYWADGIELGNSGGMTCGECSIAEATKQSLNTSFYRLQDMLRSGAMDTREMAHRLGVTDPLEDKDGFVARSITLGSYPTSMTGMANAMATIADNGVRNDAHIVQKVVTKHGSDAYRAPKTAKRVLDARITNDIDRALEPIPAYSNGNSLGGGKVGYGKTGTTQLGDTGNNRDALMVGYTDNLALAVWVGTDDGSPLTDGYGAAIWGAGLPATLWKNILTQVG